MRNIRNRQIQLLEQGKIELVSEDSDYVYYKTIVDIEAKSASNIGSLCMGNPTNGYDFFVGLNEIRKEK